MTFFSSRGVAVIAIYSIVLPFLPLGTLGWSFRGFTNTNNNSNTGGNQSGSTRRNFLAAGAGGSIFYLFGHQQAANAACLQGDLSKECIGVYKVPIDDAILPYVGTPEKLKQFAPDLNYVPPIKTPDSVSAATQILESQRLAANDIQQVVSEGRLEEAGIKVLNLLPKLTTSGKVIVDSMERDLIGTSPSTTTTIDELKFTRLKDQLNMAMGLWGQCDVEIGQGLRGEMGSVTVAQIQLLSSLRDATAALDDFMASVASLSKEKTL